MLKDAAANAAAPDLARCRVVVTGIGDAGQAAPLGGG